MKFDSVLVFTLLLLTSCDRLDGIDEGDRNTYTWKGRLVQDCNEEPAKNVDLRLEARFAGVPDDTYEEIAEGTTDDDGYFTLTYRKIRKLSATDIALVLEDGSFSPDILLNAPVNQDVYRDIAINDCHIIHVRIENILSKDSAYLTLGKPLNWNDKIALDIQGDRYPVIAIGLEGKRFENTFYIESFTASSWNNESVPYSYIFSESISDMRKALIMNLNDSNEFNTWSRDYEICGYPLIDTISPKF